MKWSRVFDLVTYNTFRLRYERSMRERQIIKEACTPACDMNPDADFYLSRDRSAGFAIAAEGELCYVFSTYRGRGDAVMQAALAHGARKLDCFDGYLPVFYGRYGFVEVDREPNWVEGEPDVVFMQLK